MATPVERLYEFAFDKNRIAQIDQSIFVKELKATLQSPFACERLLDLVSKRQKLPNSKNSHLGYVLGVTDELPIGFPPIELDSEQADIDLDFPDHRRQEVLEYIAKKYGREKVARLGTVMMYQAKSALRESAAAMDIAPWLLDPVKEVLIERADGDKRAFNTIEDTLKETVPGKKFLEKYPEILIATEMEGHPRHACLAEDTEIRLAYPYTKGPRIPTTIGWIWERYGNNKKKPLLISLHDDDKYRPQRMLKIWDSGVRECICLKFDDNSSVTCTPEHKFLINGNWKSADSAIVGDDFACMKEKIKGGRGGFKKGTVQTHQGVNSQAIKMQGYGSGKDNPNFSHGRYSIANKFRSEHLHLYCEDCKIHKGVDVHHNDHNRGKTRPDDLAWLCQSCHYKRHSKERLGWKHGVDNSTRKLKEIVNVGKKQTYDIEMPDYHNFCLQNKLLTSNSQHAAGIVITEKPISQYVVVDQRSGAAMVDKRDAEELNLLKIDALGLAQLSIFEKALELAKLPRDHLFSIPLDDPAVFDVLNRGKFTGIAQFNGQALQSIARQIEIKEFNDLAAISALARPGPLGGGATEQWVKVRRGITNPSYPHKLLEPHLKSTLGVVIYQEQVMTISREVAGMSWEDVTGLRKAMAKTQGQEVFNKYKEKFVSGCIEKKIPKPLAETLFDDLSSFGSYAFNLSHAVAYAMISYYCCWLKAYFPLEFAAATLTYTDSPETQIKLLREMAAEGVEYLPADIDLSEATWTVKKGGNWNHLVGPLNNVVGVGPKMMSTIMSCRARGEPLPERARKLLENPKTKIDSLFPIEAAFKRLMPDPKAMNIFSKPKRLIDIQTNGSEQEVLVLACVEQINPRDENDEKSLAKRKGQKMSGSTAFLNLWLADDTDTVFAKIDRSIFETYGKPIIERGRAGKALYAIKGNVPRGFRMVSVKAVRYIGDLEG